MPGIVCVLSIVTRNAKLRYTRWSFTEAGFGMDGGGDNSQGFKLRDPGHKILNRKVCKPGSVIFRKGDQGRDAYVVLRGQVDILGKNADGKLVTLATMGEGELFGEMALLNNAIRTANAVTKDGCELLVISEKTIREKLKETDPFIQSWIKFLSNRIIDMNRSQGAKKPAPPKETDGDGETEPSKD